MRKITNKRIQEFQKRNAPAISKKTIICKVLKKKKKKVIYKESFVAEKSTSKPFALDQRHLKEKSFKNENNNDVF